MSERTPAPRPRRQGKAVFRRGRAAAPPKSSSAASAAARPAAGERPLLARLRYRFDLALSRGPSVVVGWLGLLTLAIILVTALVMTIFRLSGVNGGEDALGPLEAFWQSLLRVVDAGTFAGDQGWVTRLVGLLITIAGIFIAGSLIGLIANAVDQQIEELRKGRSGVIEDDHTLILGWSTRVPAIVKELVIANESRKHAAVVVVAEHEKTQMEEALRDFVGDLRSTRIVCRTSEPWLPKTMELANLAGARSVVVISDGTDVSTVKSLLAIRAASTSIPEPRFHVVAEVNSADTAASLQALFGDNLVTVSSDAVVAELTAQACRQRGLSTVFRELLDFDGDELYFAPFPQLVGSTYAQCQLAFERCSIIGILDTEGRVQLNPAASRALADGEQLIGVAEDDSLFLPAASPVAADVLAVEQRGSDGGLRRIVIAGWSELGPRVIAELDEFLDDRTTIELVLDPAHVDVEAVRNEVTARNVRLEVGQLTGGPEVVAAHAARVSFHEVIVLGYRGALDDDEADARTLLTLLAFRQVRQHEEVGPVRMVAELLDQRNAPLAEATGVDDFIVSDELTSLMLAQLSERQELQQVFADLFDSAGCSIELRAAPVYGADQARRFADVVATASSLGDSAIGYRRAASGVVTVNPPKSAPLQLGREDEVLVVAPAVPRTPVAALRSGAGPTP